MIKTQKLNCWLYLIILTLPLLIYGQTNNTNIKRTQTLPYRYFFCFGLERNPKDIKKIKELVDIASDNGLNGMILSSFEFDSITTWKQKDILMLKELAQYCKKKNIELIPTAFSVGYGGGALEYNRNFAAALPVKIRLKAEHGKIRPDITENIIINGDLEKSNNNRFIGFLFNDKPGEISFTDSISASGKSSIRFENFGSYKHGLARIAQKVNIKKNREYTLYFKIKTEDLHPTSALKAMIYIDGKVLSSIHPSIKPTQDWTEISMDFISKKEMSPIIYIGVWEGKSGKFWIDDIRFKENSFLSDIVRRDGTPIKLKSIDRKKSFIEGKDFEYINCAISLNNITIPKGSSIKDGESLELSCYKIPYIYQPWGKQISLCMSNPALYNYWQKQAEELYKIIKYNKFLLSMDEIRNGGGCLSCKKRNLSMAQILGDCITQQYNILKNINPNIEVLIWSDMLDPVHNAHNNYYGVVGDFTGSWKFIPKDITIMCWNYDTMKKSLRFFDSHGFKTFGAAYYDSDNLDSSRLWLKALKNTKNAEGIMFTSWENKYSLLKDFSRLVSK